MVILGACYNDNETMQSVSTSIPLHAGRYRQHAFPHDPPSGAVGAVCTDQSEMWQGQHLRVTNRVPEEDDCFAFYGHSSSSCSLSLLLAASTVLAPSAAVHGLGSEQPVRQPQ